MTIAKVTKPQHTCRIGGIIVVEQLYILPVISLSVITTMGCGVRRDRDGNTMLCCEYGILFDRGDGLRVDLPGDQRSRFTVSRSGDELAFTPYKVMFVKITFRGNSEKTLGF